MINTVFRCCNQDKVEIRHGSWYEPLQDLKGKLMGVISNPPYIPTDDLPGLQPEVGWHEPKLALDGGKDGLEHLLHLCEGLSSVLEPGGFFVFEVISLSPFLKACYPNVTG